jgi:hypothetical protein
MTNLQCSPRPVVRFCDLAELGQVNGQVAVSAVPTANTSVSFPSLSASPSIESGKTGNVDIGGRDEENEAALCRIRCWCG